MNEQSITELGTILSIWAHPDDEAFLSGGLMAMAADAGCRVVCVTATRGEAGSPDHSPEAMARIREAELEACLGILGVEEHHFLDYLDGQCADVDFEEAVAKVQAIIEDVGPSTILSFGPEGFTDHPDHKAVSAWVVEAHRRAGNEAERRVHLATQTRRWVGSFGETLAALDVFPPGFPPLTAVEQLSIDAALGAEVVGRKVRALRAQESQIEGLVQALGIDVFTDAFGVERFRAL